MELLIEKMDHLGNGIGFIEGKITFVPKTIVGDKVDIKIIKETKNYNKAKLLKIINPSKDRIIPLCPYFDKCGGCQLLSMTYENTLKYKKERLLNILNDITKINDINIIENQYSLNYRNKIELKVVNSKVGFYSNETHNLIEIDNCIVTKDSINNAIELIKTFNIQNGDITIRSNFTGEILISIITQDKLSVDKTILPNYKVVGIVLNDKIIYGENHFMENINNLFFEVSYNSFFQVNSYINSQLFKIIKSNVQNENVLDLYSGVGTLSIMASKSAKKVYAIEIVENAVINAIKNAKINNCQNINFILGDAEEKIKNIKDDINTIIIDPPRKGLSKEAINTVMKFNANKIIYISCDTQSLKKNLKDLLEHYNIKEVYMLDMFSYTYHVETVCVLERR